MVDDLLSLLARARATGFFGDGQAAIRRRAVRVISGP